MSETYTDVEAMIDFHRATIVRCIREPSIVSHLVPSVIKDDDGTKLRDQYDKNDTFKATETLLGLVEKSTEPGKWKSFLDALNRADYGYLSKLLQSNARPDSNHKHERTMLQIFAPVLEQRINSMEIIDQLFAKEIINDVDRQEVFAKKESKGNTYATIILLDRMQCRQSPETWYDAFLSALCEAGYEDIVKDMEPDYHSKGDTYSLSKRKHDEYMDVDINQKRRKEQFDDSCVASTSEMSFVPSDQDPNTYLNIQTDFQNVDMSEDDMDAPSRLDVASLPELVDDTKLDLKIKQEKIDKVYKTSTCKQEPIKPERETVADSDDSPTLSENEDSTLKLRKYQQELVDKVSNKNAIICEGTGIGKTIVALQIIKKHMESSKGQGKVAFMTVNNYLVNQHFEKCQKFIPQYIAKLISSETDGQSAMLGAIIPDIDILFFTPQILVNNLESKSLENICRFSLLVFDECHNAKKGNNPYHNVMRKYLMEKHSGSGQKLPQIVGLTASVGVGHSHTPAETRDHILQLCARMDIEELPTVEINKEELLKFTAKPKEENIPFKNRKDDPCKRILLGVIEDIEDNYLQDNTFSVHAPALVSLMTKCPPNKESMEYNKWTVDVMQEANQIEGNPETSRNIIACAQYLNTFSAALEVNRLLETNDVITAISQKHLSDFMHSDRLCDTEKNLLQVLKVTQKKILKEGKQVKNPNVSTISNMLRQMLQEKGDDSRAMVFVKTRAACKALAELFARELESCSVRVKPLYGKGKRGLEEGMEEKEQNEVVEKFREGYYKVLVVTAIGTEGIDIPDCNIALCYEYSENEIRKIQMKGRIRREDGSFITVGTEKTLRQEKINVYKEAMMYNGLELARSLSAEEFSRKVKYYQQDEFQKYKIELNRLKIEQERVKPNVDFEVRCKICSTHVCNITQVRKIGPHYIVIDKSFPDKLAERPLTSKWREFDGFRKKFKLGCKSCKNDWGVAADIKGPLCYSLKLANFKFKILSAGAKFVYFKKWDDVPYLIPEVTEDELQTFSSTS